MGPHSPLAAGLVKLQAGRKVAPWGTLVVFHARVTVVASVYAGLPLKSAGPVASVCRYLFAVALRAVLPLPNRSYEAPIRGTMSLALYQSAPGSVKLRVGMSGP